MGTIVPDTLETFPECPTYGFTVEPRYLVKAIERDGGNERVDRRWSRPLNFYTAVPMGDRAEEDAQAVLVFWHAVGGMGGQFRFKDYSDFKSCPTNADTTYLDQPFEVIDASHYQLVKRYTYRSLSQLREIYKPVGSTITVGNELGVQQTDWSLDEGTGILTKGGTFSGTPSSWGGEFDIYARFTTNLSIAITNREIQNINFTLRERRSNES